MAEPIVTALSVDQSVLSDEEGFDRTYVRFTFDQDVIAYSVRCMGTSHNTGKYVEDYDKYVATQSDRYTVLQAKDLSVKDFRAIPATTIISAELDYTELYQEGINTINVYGQNEEGTWSSYNQD